MPHLAFVVRFGLETGNNRSHSEAEVQLGGVRNRAPWASFGTIFNALESPDSQLSNALQIEANGTHGADFGRLEGRHPKWMVFG